MIISVDWDAKHQTKQTINKNFYFLTFCVLPLDLSCFQKGMFRFSKTRVNLRFMQMCSGVSEVVSLVYNFNFITCLY